MSSGTIVCRAASRPRASTALATQTALAPFFLAMAMVTAGCEGSRARADSATVADLRSAKPRHCPDSAMSPNTVPGKNSCSRESPRRPPAVPHVAGDFLRPVLDVGDVLEEDRPAVEHADDQIAAVAGRRRTARRPRRGSAGRCCGNRRPSAARWPPGSPAAIPAARRDRPPSGPGPSAPAPPAAARPRHTPATRPGTPASRCVDFLGHAAQRHVVGRAALASVSVTTGTSSISTGLTTQPVTPGGTMSRFSSSFL